MTEPRSNSTDVEPLLIPVRTVAKILGISTRSVWRLHSSGKILPPVRIGGAVRWRSDELKRWVAEGCPEPPLTPRKPR